MKPLLSSVMNAEGSLVTPAPFNIDEKSLSISVFVHSGNKTYFSTPPLGASAKKYLLRICNHNHHLHF